MYRSLPSILLSGALALASGCAMYELPKQPRATMPVPAGFEVHRKARVPLEEIARETVKTTSRYNHERISFRIREVFETRTNVVDWYTPRKITAGAIPAIVELPILGGKNYIMEEYFARNLVKKGYAVALPHRPFIKDEVHALEDIDRLLKESVLDVQRTLDWMGRQKGIDTQHYGLFGISFGAIRGSLAFPLEPRIKAAVLGLVGGDLAYILAHTTQKGLSEKRDRLLEKQHLTLEEGEVILRSVITYEPLKLASSIDPRRVMLVLASRDTVVPSRTGELLWEMMGRPKKLKVFAQHISSAMYSPIITRATSAFFDEKLKK